MSVLLRTIGALGLMLISAESFALAQMNMTEGVTQVSHNVYQLHMLILWVCVIIGIGVFGAMFISMFKHRKSQGAVAANFHDNTTIEVVWTIIPFLILIGMAIPAAKTLIAMESPATDADVTVKITGYQWKWHYDYLHDGVSYFSTLATSQDEIKNKTAKGEHYLLEVDNPMVLPAGKKVRFLLTSNDVIHSWWMPAFAVKKDAIPGYINEAWTIVDKPGIYRGQCAELCGANHGFMPVVVDVKSPEDYVAWLDGKKAQAAAASAGASKTWELSELMAKGEQVYNTTCAMCHQPNGAGLPPTFPALAGSKIATGPVAGHIDIVVHGSKKNPVMAAFGPQMSDVDLAAVITYERNAFGNSTGDAVQPADIKAAR